MNVISRKALVDFWQRPGCQDAQGPLEAWFLEAKKAKWTKFSDIKATYRSADGVGSDRIIFNIHGNSYRLVVAVNYSAGIVYIKFIGTHKEYDKIDPSTVELKR